MKTFSQKCLLHIREGRIRTMTRLRKLNNESHRKEAASKRVSHSTCGDRTDSSGGDIKKGFSKRASRQTRGEAGERSGTCKAGRATGLRAAGSSTATCSSWRRKWQGGVGDEVASCIHCPFIYPLPLHSLLFPW